MNISHNKISSLLYNYISYKNILINLTEKIRLIFDLYDFFPKYFFVICFSCIQV